MNSNNMHMNKANKAMTMDGGKSWGLLAEGNAPGYRSCIQFLDDEDPNYLMAVGIPGISYSSNNGASWENISAESFYTFRKSGATIWMAGDRKIAKWIIR